MILHYASLLDFMKRGEHNYNHFKRTDLSLQKEEGTTPILVWMIFIKKSGIRKLIRFAFCYNTYPNKMIRSEKLHTYFWVVMLLPSLKKKGYISFFAKHKSANGMLLPKSLRWHKSLGEASVVEEDTIENVFVTYLIFMIIFLRIFFTFIWCNFLVRTLQ